MTQEAIRDLVKESHRRGWEDGISECMGIIQMMIDNLHDPELASVRAALAASRVLMNDLRRQP